MRKRTPPDKRQPALMNRLWANRQPSVVARAEALGLRVTTAPRRDEVSGNEYEMRWYHCPTCDAGWETLQNARTCCGGGHA